MISGVVTLGAVAIPHTYQLRGSDRVPPDHRAGGACVSTGRRRVAKSCSKGFAMIFQRALLMAATLLVASCSAASLQEGSAAARNPDVPGATGQAVVIGSSSSMEGSGRVHPDWSSASLNAQ
jgi:hypothetical protein